MANTDTNIVKLTADVFPEKDVAIMLPIRAIISRVNRNYSFIRLLRELCNSMLLTSAPRRPSCRMLAIVNVW